ncbi:BRO family protein [uncultured Ruegeria sp.]|uniref:BRO-N domain-containing protein n=1 Tax=uncultured Ruegeria sp. TaxID=259304 RepID=UPI00260459C7|nr:BRO family protein [uncultured Ruegeria sp.]
MKSITHRGQDGRSRVYAANTIRVVEIDGDPWFVAKDVTEVLSIKNITNATSNLDQTEVQNYRVPGTRGRLNKIIAESGLYKIIMRSDKHEARAFQNWVTQVVLPSIRKDGGSPHDRR